MAHLSKFNKFDIKNIFNEHERNADHYKNEVDPQRRDLNMRLVAKKFIHAKTADELKAKVDARVMDVVGKPPQAQTNIVCDWIVTYPSSLCEPTKWIDEEGNEKIYNRPKDMDHARKFMRVVVKFTADRYGFENMLPCNAHFDETTPHVHMPHIPVTISRKTGKKTVSSASLYNRRELQAYQRDLQDEMVRVFGDDAKEWILNGKTILKDGPNDIATLKAVKKVVRMDDIDEEIEKREEMVTKLVEEIEELKEVRRRATEKASEASERLQTAKDTLDALEASIGSKTAEYDDLQEKTVATAKKYKDFTEYFAKTVNDKSVALSEALAKGRFVRHIEEHGDGLKETYSKNGRKYTRTAKGWLEHYKSEAEKDRQRLIADSKAEREFAAKTAELHSHNNEHSGNQFGDRPF